MKHESVNVDLQHVNRLPAPDEMVQVLPVLQKRLLHSVH